MKNLFRTHLVSIPKGTTIGMAREIMKEKRIHHLPIVDEKNYIESVITASDLTDIPEYQKLPVEVFASHNVEFITVDESMRSVALSMIEKKISSVLLTDKDNNVVGIITKNDLLYHLADLLKPKTAEDKKSWTEMDIVGTIGEFFRRLSDIGI